MLLSKAIERLLTATRADFRSDRTIEFYRSELAPLVAFLGDVPVESITIDHLRRYIADLMEERTLHAGRSTRKPHRGKLSPWTIKARIRTMKRLFSWLEQEGHLDNNPTRRIRTPQIKRKEPRGISRSDFLALMETTGAGTVADLRDRSILLFLLDTGARIAGLCGLRIDDLDLEQGLATVIEKGDKVRFVMFSPTTAKALRDWLEVRPEYKAPWVFIGLGNASKGALKPNGVAQMLRRRAKRAGCKGPTNPHSFRHGFARHFMLNGGDLASLSRIMGHSDVKITADYYALYTFSELQEKHKKHGPFGGERDEGGHWYTPTYF
jgi:site-specific recombinase XerD